MDVLGCTGTVSQRATVLHKFILLAQALKDHAHDLYSFSAVMKALDMSQVTSCRRRTLITSVTFNDRLTPLSLGFSAGGAAADDVASAEEEPHRECRFI